MNIDIIAPIVVAILASLPGLLALNTQRRQGEASAASTLTDAAVDIVTQYKTQVEELTFKQNELGNLVAMQTARIDELKGEVGILREKVREFRLGIALLTAQIEQAGMVPQWQPRDDNA